MKEIRVGLLGFAGLGDQDHQTCMYLPDLRRRSDVVVAAVAGAGIGDEAAAEAAAVDLGLAREASAAALLERVDLEAVVICAPPDLRADLVCAALDAGRHVLADKPLALSADDVVRIRTASRRADVVVAVAQHLRQLPMLGPVIGALRAGRIGLPSSVQADFVVAGGAPVPGRELANLGIYPLDLVQQMVGRTPLRVHAVRAERGGQEGFVVMVDHENGIAATVLVARTPELVGERRSGPAVHRYRIAGSLGTLDADLTGPGVSVIGDSRRERSWIGQSTVTACVDDFLAAVRTGRPPACGPDDALVSAAVIDAAQQSLETGQPADVHIPREER